jgi:nitroreductase
MDISEAVKSRRSIRAFTDKPVDKEILREILKAAVRAPSAVNTQPWELTVVSGEVLEDIRRGNVAMLNSGAQIGVVASSDVYQGVYRQRQVDLAAELFRVMGIAREDKVRRARWRERGFRLFDAPAAIIISVDNSLDGTWSLFDLGCLSQTICLMALKYGLGSCIEAQGVMYPEVIREYTGIPENKKIVIGIAIGYPDTSFPANSLITSREDVDSITSWHGFK